MGRPTFEQIREENDPGCIERERLEREAPVLKARVAELEAMLRELVTAFNPEPAFDYRPLGIWDRAAQVLQKSK